MSRKRASESPGERYDIMTPEQRSRLMARVKGTNTGPERRLRSALWRRGLRYRLGARLPGKPDLVFPRARLAVFVDGCFWHRCPLHATYPKTNRAFWEEKLRSNVERDRRVDERLAAMGWRVLRFWEHEVEADVEDVAKRIAMAVREARA